MKEYITAVLASTVIASIISAVITYFQFKKNNQLSFITNERKKWRSDIRNIARKIELAKTYEELQGPLVDLKVHINAYGKNSNDVMKDSHIWEVIDKLENQEEYEQLKKLLVLYLSTLLKMDWERSKEEVRGNKYQIVLYLTVLCSVISILYGYFVRLKSSLDILGLFLILIEVYPVIMPRRMGMNHDKALEWFSKDKNTFVNQFVKTMCICILCFGGLTLVVCYLNNMKNFELVFDWSFYLLIVSFLVRFLQEYQKYSLEVYYYENILRCKQNVYIGQRQ